MKKLTTISGFISALAIMIAMVFKFNHFSGAGSLLAIAGLLIGFYFAIYIMNRMNEKNESGLSPSSIVAAICVLLINLGITFRIWHWTGANILLTLGLMGFSVIFIPMFWLYKSKQPNFDRIMNIAGALGLMTFALGTLLKLLHWQGAPILLSLSPVFLFLIYFPKYIINDSINKESKSRYLRESFLVIIIGALVALYFIKSIEIHDMDAVDPTMKTETTMDNVVE